jgi:glycosyltransferase involved in cell wall biosynthesis
MMNNEPRVLVLWPHIPGYLSACLKILLTEYNVSLFVIVQRPYLQPNHIKLQKFSNFSYLDLSSSDCPSEAEIKKMVADFRPSILVMSSMKRGIFVRLAKVVKRRGALTIWAADNYWKGSWRDYVNSILSRIGIIYSGFDIAWIPGTLGRQYAQRMSYDDEHIFENLLSCDTELFLPIGIKRFSSELKPDWPRVFLFVGQYIWRKNLDTLLKAYSIYRGNVTAPWELWFVGSGPLSSMLQGRQGVKDMGYQSAENCAELMGRSGGFILPSRFDHWGVVIHEAACAGLPILASKTCGAVNSLVREGYNGFTFHPEDSGMLANLMGYITAGDRAKIMGENSLRTSYQYNTKLWSRTLIEDIPFRLKAGILAQRKLREFSISFEDTYNHKSCDVHGIFK